MPNEISCPFPTGDYDRIVIAHGGGGRMTQQLVDTVFRQAFTNASLDAQHDGAVLPPLPHRMAVTTDSHVVSPLFFPGGDIGSLSVYGTVNDLAMCGARPLYLTAGFIIEEGLPVDLLRKVADSMGAASREVGCAIVTGDTKVLEKGKGDGIFINTTGVGEVLGDCLIGPGAVASEDAVILSGDIGRHGMAVMAAREGLDWDPPIASDCASLVDLVMTLCEDGMPIHCMRDLTRGGLATALVEIARTANLGISIEEDKVAVSAQVAGACELLGMDPFYVANEGRFLMILPAREADRAVAMMNRHPLGKSAARIGTVTGELPGTVQAATGFGTTRILAMLSGEQLPRIC